VTIRHTLLAVALASCFAQSSIAATAESNEPTYFGEINGHQYEHFDHAIWATDGGTFDLTSATISTPWPWIGAEHAVPGDTYYDSYVAGETLWVTGYNASNSGTDYAFRLAYHLAWDTPTSITFDYRNVDLVVFNADAYSDGARAFASNMTGRGITPAVPEPETYAMMLAGLGITALATRKRRKAA